MDTQNWYAELIKPSWAPPAWVFGPAWTFLYLLIIISFGKVFLMAWEKEIALIVIVPFVLNIIFNLAFTPLQFGLRSNMLATIDITFVLITLIWAMVAIFPHARFITYMQIPYLLWVCFATALQYSIAFLNR